MQLVIASSSSAPVQPTWPRFLGTLALGAVCLLGTVAAFAAQPAHLTKGLQLADEIGALQDQGIFTDTNGTPLNRYGGSWGSPTDASYIRFLDTAAAVRPANNTRCAPFVTHLLQSVYNFSWSAYLFTDPLTGVVKSSASPAPYQMIALLDAGQGFAAKVTRLDQAQPGDVLLWAQAGTDEKDHAMLIVSVRLGSAKPYPSSHSAAKAEFAGTTYYEVEILDSSSSLHTADSRLVPVNGTDTHVPGLGTGTIGVLVDANFAIVGVTWSLPTSDYVAKRTGWLNGLHDRLKLKPAYAIEIGRLPAMVSVLP